MTYDSPVSSTSRHALHVSNSLKAELNLGLELVSILLVFWPNAFDFQKVIEVRPLGPNLGDDDGSWQQTANERIELIAIS